MTNNTWWYRSSLLHAHFVLNGEYPLFWKVLETIKFQTIHHCFLISKSKVILQLDYAAPGFFLELGTLGWGLIIVLDLLSFSNFAKLCENTSVKWWDLELNVKGKNSMVVCLSEGMSVCLRKDLIWHGVSPFLQKRVYHLWFFCVCKNEARRHLFLKGLDSLYFDSL